MQQTTQLTSTDPIALGKERPPFAAWFGNFFDPYYTDMDANRAGPPDVAAMGFNSIFLDSKLWDDFWEFYHSGKASLYVEGQQVIIDAAKKAGLGTSFLAFFNVADNLYPEIRDELPRIVNKPTGKDGRPLLGYRHWRTEQLGEFVEHVKGLHEKLAGDGVATAVDQDGNERLPFYFYHSPAFIPSFDEDGRRHYLDWLQKEYSLHAMNLRYGTRHFAFDEMTHADFWVGDEPYAVPSETAYAERNFELKKWADNVRYKREVLKDSMRRLVDGIRAYEPRLYLYSCLTQWKYLMTEWIHLYSRGLDLWAMGELLDSPSFYTLPADAYSEANAHVVPMEMAMMRSASQSGGFLGGLFVGRYIHNDIYAVHTPAECIASAYGAGAIGLYFYGYNGLDDGGNFGKWGERERRSLKDGLDWFADVREVSGSRIQTKDAAILFPDASYALSNPQTFGDYASLRNDCLGWYQQLADHGINADILHPRQVADGALDGYKLLVLPADPLYAEFAVDGLDGAVRSFVEAGGKLLSSASSALKPLLGIDPFPHADDSMDWEERLIDHSPNFVCFADGEAEATYLGSGRTAIARHLIGEGEVLSLGIDYGYAYITRQHRPVPRQYGYDNHYPLTMAKRTPVDKYLERWQLSKGRLRGVERVPFEYGELWINHSSYPVELPAITKNLIRTDSTREHEPLTAHQAAFLIKD
jgi:hypothetical protein